MAFNLKSIQRGKQYLPPRIVLYGVHGIGKTTWLAGAKNVIVGMVESGARGLDVDKQPLNSFDEVMDFLEALYTQEHGYEYVGLDTLDKIEEFIWRKICDDNKVEHMEDVAYGKLYSNSVDYWKMFLSALDTLQADKNIGCILIGHSKVKSHNPPDMEAYDKYNLNLHVSKSIDVPTLLCNWADVVGFVNYRTFVKKEKIAGGKNVIKVDNADGASYGRILYLTERPAFSAKNRYDLPDEMPFPKENGFQIVEDGIKQYFQSKQ